MAQMVKNLSEMWETEVWSRRQEHPLEKGITFLVAQLVKNLPAMWETWVGSLGWKIP